MIVFNRTDDRLIHGQVQTKIIPMNSVNRVICVDAATATMPLLKNIFEKAAPTGVKCTVHTMEEAIPYINRACENDLRVLLLARRPSTFVQIYKTCVNVPKTLNIANIPKSGDEHGIQLSGTTWINDEELKTIKELDEIGVDMYFQLFPGDPYGIVYWKDVRNKY